MEHYVAPPRALGKEEWPPNYREVYEWRQRMYRRYLADDDLLVGARAYYATNHADFILHWMDTYDPRNAQIPGRMARMPFIMFQKQVEMLQYLDDIMAVEADGLVEKSRDMGATWLCSAKSICLWLFVPGVSIGWGSRKEALVDKNGDPDSIFEKLRLILDGLPNVFLPKGFNWAEHSTHMKLINPENGAQITGEAGDNIGRGGRKTIYFKDESAHYERPMKIEAALGDNTRVQVDISSVNGIGNVFHRRRESGAEWSPQGGAVRGKTNIFVMDWSDHPDKDQEWYNARRQKAEDDGLLHVFRQEVDRDYGASLEGVLIMPEWVNAAVDARLKLGLEDPTGPLIAGMDPADEGNDLHAISLRRGYELLQADCWGAGDTGHFTRKAVVQLRLGEPVNVQYDCIGVGAGVKSEANRLIGDGLLPEGMTFTPWNAADSVLNPKAHSLRNADGSPDRKSPKNEDLYHNLKAQAWWNLRLRFERTYRAITNGEKYPAEELISISSSIPKLQALKKELSQATVSKTSSSLKLVVDKSPSGTRSPNMADAVVMAFTPFQPKTVVGIMR